jgi:hypothetical protein
MKTFLMIATLAMPVLGQVSRIAPPATLDAGERAIPGRNLYNWSVAAVVAANAADIASSWHGQEANPFVAGGGSQFGMKSVAIKSGFVATSLLIQHVALRHRPDLHKRMAWLNFATAGVLSGVAKHNYSVR